MIKTLQNKSELRLIAAVDSVESASFASFTYTSKESGEKARHVLILGADYGKLVNESIAVIAKAGGSDLLMDTASTKVLTAEVNKHPAGSAALKLAKKDLNAFQETIGAVRAATAELYISLTDSLVGLTTGEGNPAYTKADTYEHICPGITRHLVDGTFEVAGLSHTKVVLTPGVFKSVNSSEKTKAKDALRKTLPIVRYRTFCLDAGNMESVKINGREIVFSKATKAMAKVNLLGGTPVNVTVP